jgi:hypothetical protein
MQREITDGEKVTGTCIQAFNSAIDPSKAAPARVEGYSAKGQR